MSQIMKAFTGIFLVLFLTAASMGVLGAFLQVARAQSFHAAVIDELENSDYSKMVLEECLLAAQNNKYRIQITLYEKEGGYMILSALTDIPANELNIDLARVDMTFTICIPLLGVENQQVISGYGR